ncbi:acetyltransferase (GNAT) family protein [Sediminihabitans luteus]|uniref:Acetyltransferase (GNAT) family protein n=1 Tax=Sediminihabitans luteus TaxID=1138585 RepID=A0A2M9CQD7_9CELL|nr:peptidoglycan bridge formation glycyltransferase FemA/FemB family protein [Sediminihabitans luteus]PJJ74107.1 acetyltransferase (GNAT) family protein [Sediminihabitans luteus]GII97978.1 FemA-like protein [Sediminihabitans luteus]
MHAPNLNLTVDEITDRSAWDRMVLDAGGHPLQLWGWGEVKATGAWTPRRLRVTGPDGVVVGLAQVLVRSLPAQFKALAHVPRGPVVISPDPAADDVPADLPEGAYRGGGYGVGTEPLRSQVSAAVVSWCKDRVGGVGITLEPDWPEGSSLELEGARPSPNPILYPSTLILDLTRSPEDLTKVMGKSTRYDIRKAARTGLEVRRVQDESEVRAVLEVYKETAARAGFALHDDDYYLAIHRELGEHSVLVAAFADGAPVSFVWCVQSASTSFELYGGIDDAGRRLRANAPVKWHAVEVARAAGVVRYDMNGLLNDGISEFKKSFAQHSDELVRSVDVPFSMWYSAWNNALPTAKKVVRKLRGSR